MITSTDSLRRILRVVSPVPQWGHER